MVSAAGPVLVDFGIAMGRGRNHVTRTGLVMRYTRIHRTEIIDGANPTTPPIGGRWRPCSLCRNRRCSAPANLAAMPGARPRATQIFPGPMALAAFRSALDPDRRDRCAWIIAECHPPGTFRNPNAFGQQTGQFCGLRGWTTGCDRCRKRDDTHAAQPAALTAIIPEPSARGREPLRAPTIACSPAIGR